MKNNGFTLIELMIVIFITVIVSIAIVTMYSGLTKSTTDQRRKMSMQQNGRAALNFIANELLTSGYCIDLSKDKIQGASLSGITFTRDLNSDGIPEKYNISQNADTIVRTDFTSGEAVSENIINNVETFIMLYGFDIDNTGVEEFGQLEQHNGEYIWAYDSTGDNIMDQFYFYNNTVLTKSTESINIEISRIRAVKLMLIVKSDNLRHNKNILSRTDFRVPDPTQVDDFIQSTSLDKSAMYKFFTTTVKLRNMNMQFKGISG